MEQTKKAIGRVVAETQELADVIRMLEDADLLIPDAEPADVYALAGAIGGVQAATVYEHTAADSSKSYTVELEPLRGTSATPGWKPEQAADAPPRCVNCGKTYQAQQSQATVPGLYCSVDCEDNIPF